MTRAIHANTLKTQLGAVLRDVGADERFVVLRRNKPVAVVVSIAEYARQHPDRYEDTEDFLDTFLEESDPQFQRSLKRGTAEAKRGRTLSHAQLKLALASQHTRKQIRK